MSIEKSINSQEELNNILETNNAVLLYFKTDSCVVGEAVEPKVNELTKNKFPKLACYSIDMNISPDISANYSVFAEPTILVIFAGKETIRKSRSFSIFEVEEAIERPYKLIFE